VSPKRLTTLALAFVALAATGCGGDDDGEATAGDTTVGIDEIVESPGELPDPLVADLEARCAEFRSAAGSLKGDASAPALDELETDYLADLEELSARVPEPQRPAWDGYLAAQDAAFALTPPDEPGEPQTELEAANAAAEAQAAELGFASCSSV
jgi:hypothetical protein